MYKTLGGSQEMEVVKDEFQLMQKNITENFLLIRTKLGDLQSEQNPSALQ